MPNLYQFILKISIYIINILIVEVVLMNKIFPDIIIKITISMLLWLFWSVEYDKEFIYNICPMIY